MEIIVTHDNADFDALASLVAAKKLYPAAEMVLGKRVSGTLKDFLSLHKDRFRALAWNEVPSAQVTRMVVVDVRRASRLQHVEGVVRRALDGDPALEIHLYDHHPAADDDLRGSLEVVEPVGSATTLLVERIREAGLTLDGTEATLLALGIHTDTGSLTYAQATGRDADALAWLFTQELSLATLNRYLRDPPAEEQRMVLRELIGRAEPIDLPACRIAVVSLALDRVVSGLNEITNQLLMLEGHDALFGLFAMPKGQIQVVARSRSSWIDVGRIAQALGGGGHSSAAAATLKDTDLGGVRARIEAELRASPPRPRLVGDVMSSPVHTVDVRTPLEVLDHSLREWRHTGVPVTKDGKLTGIVSARDVESARRDGKLHLNVGARMSQNVKTAAPEEALEAAMQRMVAADVGRLPVLRDGRLVGILTRSDLLRHLYGPDVQTRA